MPNGIRMNITVAPYSKISFGVWALPPPVPPPGRCAWLASATTASSAVSAIPLSTSLREPLMAETLDKHGDRAALGLEDRVLDVAEILAVGLQRQRPVAGDLDPVEVVAVDARRALGCPLPVTRWRSRRGRVAAATRFGATRSRPSSKRASGATWIGIGSGVRVRVGVRDERERRAAEPADLEHGLEAQRAAPRPGRTAAAMKAASPGRLPSSRRPRASTRRTSSASKPSPAEKLKRRPFTRPTEIVRVRARLERFADLPRRGSRVARQAERAREHVRAAAGKEAERHPGRRAVQRPR